MGLSSCDWIVYHVRYMVTAEYISAHKDAIKFADKKCQVLMCWTLYGNTLKLLEATGVFFIFWIHASFCGSF